MQWLGHFFDMQHVKTFDPTTETAENTSSHPHTLKKISQQPKFFPAVSWMGKFHRRSTQVYGCVLSTENMPITKLVGENAETQIVICKGLCAARKWLQLLGKSRMWITWMWKPFIWYMLSIIGKHIICIAEAKRQQKSDLIFHDMAYYLAWSSLVSYTLETCLA